MKIDETLDELVNSIKTSDIYQTYLHILKQVENNKDINNAVKNIKSIQQKIVKETAHKGNNIIALETTLEKYKEELYNIPLYQEYINAAAELNDLMKLVHDRMQLYLNNLNI